MKKIGKYRVWIEHMNQKQADELYDVIINYANSQDLFAFTTFHWANAKTGKRIIPSSKKAKDNK